MPYKCLNLHPFEAPNQLGNVPVIGYSCHFLTLLYQVMVSNLITCLSSFIWNKNSVRLQKKRKKVDFGDLRTEVVKKFSVRLQKKKEASFKNIHCKGDSINYMNLSML